MLCFDIRSLENRAETVDGLLEASDAVWQDQDARPVGEGVRVQGRLSSAGHGRFYFSGLLQGTAALSCRRCLADVEVPVSEEVHLLFADAASEEADEADVYQIPAGSRQLDMAPAVREEWLLAAPAFALCREDCKGLCTTCGADHNVVECDCTPISDPRWDDLRVSRDDHA
jgi:uncharacterized protein